MLDWRSKENVKENQDIFGTCWSSKSAWYTPLAKYSSVSSIEKMSSTSILTFKLLWCVFLKSDRNREIHLFPQTQNKKRTLCLFPLDSPVIFWVRKFAVFHQVRKAANSRTPTSCVSCCLQGRSSSSDSTVLQPAGFIDSWNKHNLLQHYGWGV